MNIIDERAKRTIRRKIRKRDFDDRMDLALSDRVQTVRLLDEGAVMGYDSPNFYIKKGTLAKYLRKLPADYEGTINLGHMDFATFPFILGTWSKKDMHLVDIGDGRHALDIDLRLDEGSVFVQELRRAPYTLGVSAEFYVHDDEENSKKFNLEIVDEVFITDFAIVGECGNVNSSGIRLSGGDMTAKELTAALDMVGTADLSEVNKKLDALLEKELTTAEEEAAEVAGPAEEVKEEAAEEVKEEAAEEAAEPVAEPEVKEEAIEPEQPKALSAIAAVMESLTKENADLKQEVSALKATLSARDKAEQEFVEKFKNLSISLSTESVAKDVEESTEQNVFTDGIGEI